MGWCGAVVAVVADVMDDPIFAKVGLLGEMGSPLLLLGVVY